MTENEALVRAAKALIAGSQKLLFFTGAGVSTESGIPDFRGPQGIWQRYDPEDFTIQRFLNDEKTRELHWKLFSGDEFGMIHVQPNPAHFAIAALQKSGKVYGVVTQNVDGLHQKAGLSEDLVFQLHGDLSHARCLDCGRRFSMDKVVGWISADNRVPSCRDCGGLLKPDAVLFGEILPTDILAEAERRAKTCDLCVVLGSTLSVYPAAFIPQYAVDAGAKLAIINQGPTELDHLADIRIEGRAGEILPRLLETL